MYVVLADLVCRGEEHLEFNAGLIEAVACHADRVLVLAEKGLIDRLKPKLVVLENVDFHSYRVFLPKNRVCNYVSYFLTFVQYFLITFKLREYRKILLAMDVFLQPACFRALATVGLLERVIDAALLHHLMPRLVRVPKLARLYEGMSSVDFYSMTCGGVDMFNEITHRANCSFLPHPLNRANQRPVCDPEGAVKVFTFGKHAKSILDAGALGRYLEYTSQLIVDDFEVHLYLRGEGEPEVRAIEGVVVYYHYYRCHFSIAEYEQLFLDHNLFWMSASTDYEIRASGVVFDSIRLGCFVVDPSGVVLSSNIPGIVDVQLEIISTAGGVRRGLDFQMEARRIWEMDYEAAIQGMLT